MTNPPPQVSVILPTYNRMHLLPRAIGSVLGQSFRDFELIVVDDGSTDGTEEMVRSISDPRVVYLPPGRNLGDARARNRGAAVARGEWLAFQDSDDEWLVDKLERQIAVAAGLSTEFAAVGGPLLRVIGGRIDEIRWPLASPTEECGEIDRAAFLRGFCAYLQSLIVRRSAFEALGGFDPRLYARSDFEFCLRVVQSGRVATLTGAPVAVSYETPTGISLRTDYRRADIEYVLTCHAALIEADRSVAASYWYDLAKTQALMSEHGALSSSLKALRRDPLQLRAWLLLALLPFGARWLAAASRLSMKLRA